MEPSTSKPPRAANTMRFVSPRGSSMLLATAELTANPLADNEDGGREGFNAVVTDPRDFADTYFPAFRSCAQRAGASGVMCSAYPACLGSIHLQLRVVRAFARPGYNAVNGTASCANPWMLSIKLRGDWSFDVK